LPSFATIIDIIQPSVNKTKTPKKIPWKTKEGYKIKTHTVMFRREFHIKTPGSPYGVNLSANDCGNNTDNAGCRAAWLRKVFTDARLQELIAQHR